MIWDILLIVFAALFCGFVGAHISLKCLKKNTNEMIESCDRLVACQNNIIYINNKLIENQRKVIENVYTKLVRLRDDGGECLDEVIGYLGEMLDDHSED